MKIPDERIREIKADSERDAGRLAGYVFELLSERKEQKQEIEHLESQWILVPDMLERAKSAEKDNVTLREEIERLRKMVGNRADYSDEEFETAWKHYLTLRRQIRESDSDDEKGSLMTQAMEHAKKYSISVSKEEAKRLGGAAYSLVVGLFGLGIWDHMTGLELREMLGRCGFVEGDLVFKCRSTDAKKAVPIDDLREYQWAIKDR